MKNRIKNILKFREEDLLIKNMITGLHIEGPFLNSRDGYRGAHPKEFIKNANIKEMGAILDASDGLVKLVTLAPEVYEEFEVTKMLSNKNIVVSVGHSNASLNILKGAIDNGLSMFTHLGNGCRKCIARQV
jgi:N-acetylglucosamine-6-phosphate deacetylase